MPRQRQFSHDKFIEKLHDYANGCRLFSTDEMKNHAQCEHLMTSLRQFVAKHPNQGDFYQFKLAEIFMNKNDMRPSDAIHYLLEFFTENPLSQWHIPSLNLAIQLRKREIAHTNYCIETYRSENNPHAIQMAQKIKEQLDSTLAQLEQQLGDSQDRTEFTRLSCP